MTAERRGKRIDDLPDWAKKIHEEYGSPELSDLEDVFHGPLLERKSGLRKDDIIEVLLDARSLPKGADPWVRGNNPVSIEMGLTVSRSLPSIRGC